MMFTSLSVGSSSVGSPVVFRKMLNFAARRRITPVNEHFSTRKVNDAFEPPRSR
jgi:uncharacterized zinc-type alcohol dehydrogenase-like protein